MDMLFALMFALDLNMTWSIKIDSLLKVPRLFRNKEKPKNFLTFQGYTNLDQYHLAMESWEFSKQ